MKSTGITKSNFNGKLSGAIRSTAVLRDNLQNLILFGMEHYHACGDTGYLTTCMQKCVGVNALPTGKMKQFIQAHANVSWREVEIKKGVNAGKKAHVFKARTSSHEYTEPTVTWYDYSRDGDAVADMDTAASIINLTKRIAKGLETGKVKNKKIARAHLKALTAISDVA